MRDSYNGDFNDTEASAVAKLMFDAGLSVSTEYESNGSWAYSCDIAPALIRNFKYSKDARMLLRQAFTSQQWIDIIRENLAAKRPVIYGANTSVANGHEFVCDGIDRNDYLHINWGWNGSYDGYFDMNVLDPYGSGSNYYKNQEIIVDIHPGDPDADNLDYEAPLSVWDLRICSSTMIPEVPYAIIDAKFDDNGKLISSDYSFSIAFNLFNNTKTALSHLPLDSNINTPIDVYGALYDLNKNYISSFGYEVGSAPQKGVGEFKCICNLEKVADGTYFMSLVRKKETGKDSEGNSIYELDELNFMNSQFIKVVKKNGGLYFEQYNAANRVDVPVEFVSMNLKPQVYEHANNKMSFSLKNSSGRLIDNDDNRLRISYYILPVEEETEYLDMSNRPTTADSFDAPYVYPGETVESSLFLTTSNLSPGKYRIYFSCNRNGEVELARGEKYYFEVIPLPDDGRPIVITDALTSDRKSFYNIDNQDTRFSLRFLNVSTTTKYYTRVWAAPIDNPDEKFLLYEPEELQFFGFDKERTMTIHDTNGYYLFVDLLWKTPGKYRIWLSLSADRTTWVDYDEDGSCGIITIKEFQHPDVPLVMSAPAQIAKKNTLTGCSFNAVLKFKASQKVSLNPDDINVMVKESPESETTYGWSSNIVLNKMELDAGDEMELRCILNFYNADEIKDKTLMVLPYFVRTSRYFINPAEYKESLYFSDTTSSEIAYDNRFPLVMIAPAEFSPGKNIYPGDYFDAVLKLKAQKAYTFNFDEMRAFLESESGQGFVTNAVISVDKTTLQEGDEVELHITAQMTDIDYMINQNLIFSIKVFDEGSQEYVSFGPGEYKASLSLACDPEARYCPIIITRHMTFEKDMLKNYIIDLADNNRNDATFFWRSRRPSIDAVDMTCWAQLINNPDETFNLFFYGNHQGISLYQECMATVSLVADPLWKTPGEYNVWFEYDDICDENGVPYNSGVIGSFTIADEISPELPLVMTAPAVIPREVRNGDNFDIIIKAKAMSPFTLEPDKLKYWIAVDHPISGHAYSGRFNSFSADKYELQTGDEVTIRVQAPCNDEGQFLNKNMVFTMVTELENGIRHTINPGEYQESLWFHASPDASVESLTADSDFCYRFENDVITVEGLLDGDVVELWDVAGMKMASDRVICGRCEIATSSFAKGIYILKAVSRQGAGRVAKLSIRK